MTAPAHITLTASRQVRLDGLRFSLAVTKLDNGTTPLARIVAGTAGESPAAGWYSVGDTVQVGDVRFRVVRIVLRKDGGPRVLLSEIA